MVEAIRKKVRHGRKLIAVAMGAFGFFILAGHQVAASETRTVPVTINPGEAYTIQNVSPDSTPGVKVVSNPSALVVHTDAPGKIVLLGAAAGSWDIDVTLASGEKVTYVVDVQPTESAKGPLAAATNAAASSDSAPAGGAVAAPAVASRPADIGSGPVDAAAAAATSGGAATASATSGAAEAARAADSSSSAPVAAARVPAAEPVRVASADPAGPIAAAAPPAVVSPVAASPAPAAAMPPTVVAEASTPESSTATPDSVSPIVLPSSSGGDNGMLPSQAVSGGASGSVRTFNTDPLAVIPSGPPPVGQKHYMPGDGVDLMAGTSEVLDYPTRIRRVSIADSKVADIQVINPYELNLVAHQTGFTTLAVWDTQGRYSEREVRVDESGKQQVLLNVIVAELDRSRIENFGINWSMALPKWNISLVNMAGGVATPYNATSSLTANSLISSNPPVTVSTSASGTLPPNGTMIPLLLSQNLTYGLAAGNNNIQTQSFFQFLEENSMGKILAEPHLLANSGEKAEFLSGGEIPIVISQALNTSIVFKQFGTSIIFVPTVIGFDDILLKVKPEVSEPDYAHGVNLFGFTVPAFVTRKAETMVRLRNNQTLIIAGLLLNTKNETVAKVPYLGDIPYIRGLFRNTSYSHSQTDLVMTVTPQIVAPLPSNGRVALPTDRGPMSLEEIKTRRVYPEDAARPRF
ncbi:MAG TPA: pilus assembly protein N-terminal domain-containing protein [Candidatus Binataceae bacterium]|nr:pilus assembly protein N-terminal domain-containing protein [Candidatus Binataceae bacterium]